MDKILSGFLLFGLIMFFVFGINYINQRVDMGKIPQQKRNKYLTWFWYFYGVFYLLYGLKDIFIYESFLEGSLWVIISATILVLNYKGKVFSNSFTYEFCRVTQCVPYLL
jgi:hypothetical protein